MKGVPSFIRRNYDCAEWRHGIAILRHEFPSEWSDICQTLTDFRLLGKYVTEPGGSKSQVAKWIDGQLIGNRGWVEKKFETEIRLDGKPRKSPTHSVDCFKGRVALEIEWNNKDPFYDRDLNNFRLLFDLGAISVGVIITRADELQEIFHKHGRGSSYGNSTTHWSKLLPRIEGGGGGGCPIVAFGIRKSLYVA